MKRLKAALAVALVVLPLAAAPPRPHEVRELRGKLEELHSKLRASQGELDEANQREAALATQLGLTQGDLEDFSRKLREVRTNLRQAETRLMLLKRDIEETRATMLINQHALERRLVDMNMEGETSYLSVLFQSSSFSDFLNQSEYFQRLVERDRTMIAQVRRVQQQLETQEAAATRTVEEIRELKNSFEDKVQGLEQLQDKQASLLAQLQTERKRLEQYVNGLEHLSAAMETRLQHMIRERSTPGQAPVSAGRYLMPVHGPITSPFGYRVHPVTGETRFHSGLDIAVDYGTPIRAADNGVVIYAEWYGGYGNCVIIQHGGEYSTLYGHCSKLLVAQGQRVRQGQVVAECGSTGMSTGPHVHFEVRQNGTPIDPNGRL